VSTATPGPGTGGETRPLGEIFSDVSRDLSDLVRQEIDLAKIEMKQEATKVGKGAGLLGGAGIAGLLTAVFLSLSLVYLLDNWIPAEVAALIVGVLWGICAAALAARGRKDLQQANPQLPTTQHTVKEDVQWARAQKSG
jgi:F0F1-type ATP synthase assembly protein I